MRIAPFSHDLRLWFRTPGDRSDARGSGRRERSGVPWHESLLLAALLLVVAGWIILRLLLALFVAH